MLRNVNMSSTVNGILMSKCNEAIAVTGYALFCLAVESGIKDTEIMLVQPKVQYGKHRFCRLIPILGKQLTDAELMF
jgi:hypothetical protein